MSDLKILVMDFNEETYNEQTFTDIKDLNNMKPQDSDKIRWIHYVGLDRKIFVDEIGKKFELHPLIIDDLLDFNPRPKMDIYDNHLYLTMNILNWKEQEKVVESEQVNIIYSKNYIISMEEQEKIVFEPLINKLRQGKGKFRQMSIDYLMYSLIDDIIDQYFEVLENFNESIENLENELINSPQTSTISSVHFMRREAMTFRKCIWPLREIIRRLERGEIKEITKTPSLTLYYRDLYDHSVQIIESLENIRDLLSGMVDIYLSSYANKQNEVMKVLTIISTIFIPLTFIAGVYGMNFKYFPEIEHPLGYLAFWIVILGLVIFMLSMFAKRGWIKLEFLKLKFKRKKDE